MPNPTPERHFPFTQKRLKELPAGAKRVWYYDTLQPGLAVAVYPTGGKAFYLIRRVGGRPTYNRLGGFPGLTVDQARKAAAKLAGEIATGSDPVRQRTQRRQEITLGRLWELWLDGYALAHKKASSLKEDRRQFGKFLSAWEGRRLSTITRAEAAELHQRIGRENGPTAANRLIALLSSLFNYGADDLELPIGNPCRAVRRFKEKSRERHLLPSEVQPFFAALAAEPDPFGDFFALLLWTAVRKSNLLNMRWADLRLEDRLWIIPDTKSNEGITVPLPDPAVEILQARREFARGDYVFPGPGKTGHLVEVRGSWQRIRKAANVPDLNVHDLRRSMASFMTATGASLTLVGKYLGHLDHDSTQVYARADLAPIRRAVDLAVGEILRHNQPE